MSAPHWRESCSICGSVLGAFSLSGGKTDYDAVSFFGKPAPNISVDRLVEGDDGYPVVIGHLCIHHGGSWVPPDPNQGDLFSAGEA